MTVFTEEVQKFLEADPPSRCAATARHVPERFRYDDDGNLTRDGRFNYEWDGEPPTPRLRRSGNRLIAVESLRNAPRDMPRIRVTFQYDGQSRRIRKTVEQFERGNRTTPVSDNTYLYDGWNLVQETITGGTSSVSSVTNHYTWGIDLSGTMQGAGGVGGLLAVSTFNVSLSTFHVSSDANGNAMSYHDNTGTTVAAYEYDPFGRTIEANGPMASAFPYRFSTKYTDDETGLVYYGYRYYNPELGRWLSRDPAGEIVGGIHRYMFVHNSPASAGDYLGLWSIDLLGVFQLGWSPSGGLSAGFDLAGLSSFSLNLSKPELAMLGCGDEKKEMTANTNWSVDIIAAKASAAGEIKGVKKWNERSKAECVAQYEPVSWIHPFVEKDTDFSDNVGGWRVKAGANFGPDLEAMAGARLDFTTKNVLGWLPVRLQGVGIGFDGEGRGTKYIWRDDCCKCMDITYTYSGSGTLEARPAVLVPVLLWQAGAAYVINQTAPAGYAGAKAAVLVIKTLVKP